MAGLIDPNDIAKARQSGYSDQEISTFLADKHPDQFKVARDAGYSDKEILSHLSPVEQAPSGVIAGFQHGVAGVASGPASTIGLTGASTPTLDAVAAGIDAKNYKSAPIFDKDGFHPSNIMQSLAEAAPGLGTDIIAGKTAAALGNKIGGVRGAAVGGLGGFLGSALLRNFGPGAHANADARTGVPNSPVETTDLTREASKQALEAVPNMLLGGRVVPGASKALAESALAKLATTGAIGGGVGAANDAINQIGTTAGSKDGLKYDWHGGANSAVTGALLNTAMAAPRALSDTIGNSANRGFEADPETRAAAAAVANRNVAAADGQNLVGPLGGTQVAKGVKTNVLAGIQRELAAAANGEDNLSPDSANTLANIQAGRTASSKELTALSTEASPETVHLARQALISSQVKDTGGMSGAMDKLSPISNPVKSTALAAAGSVAGHAGLGMLGTMAPAALAALFGTYGLARTFDTSFGTRSPMNGFTNHFADPSAPIRTPEPQAPVPEPVSTSVPQIAPPQDTALWGSTPDKQPNLRATLNSNAKVEEGMAKIAKQLGAQKKASMISDAMPALQALAARKKAMAPDETPPVTDAPASPAIAQAMQTVASHAPPAPAAAPPTSMSDILAKAQVAQAPPAAPAPPMIAKITKKMGKPVEETPHENAYTPMDASHLWGKGLSHDAFAQADAAKLPDLKYPDRYMAGIIRDRKLRQNSIGAELGDDTGPNAQHALDLLEELHHTRRADKASGAVHHFTAKMSPAMRDAMRARLGKGFVNSIWSK